MDLRQFVILIGLLCLAGLANAFSQQDRVVSGPQASQGAELVERLCVGCHDLETTTLRSLTREEWQRIVDEMIHTHNAAIRPDEATKIVAHLAEYQGRSAGQSGESDEGERILAARCFGCHNEVFWSALRQDRRAWEGVLYRMVGRGALWTETEINLMADYLVENFGPPAPDSDEPPGRQP